MNIRLKSAKEQEVLREGGRRLSLVMQKVAAMVEPGITTKQLDQEAQRFIKEMGDTPSFLNYRPEGVKKKYPAALCTSLNEEIVHCVPGPYALEEGDIISLDLGLNHVGMFTDHAVTIMVGQVDPIVKNLVNDTKTALDLAIKAAQPGNKTGDVGAAVENFVKKRYGIVRDLAGHGVGHAVHEDPYVPNFGKPGTGEELVPGMVIAIEPMLTLGTDEIIFEDEYTVVTGDGSLSAHFEHTVIITENGPEVVTAWR